MKYASVFATILIIWIAVIIIALFIQSGQRLQLFVLVTIFTLVLFVIGFRKRH